MEPPLCVVSSWVIKRVYIIFIWNTISESFNFDIFFLSLFNPYTNITSQNSLQLLFCYYSIQIFIFICNLYSWPPYGSIPVLPGYLLLWHCWVIRVYTILVWNTISGSSNLDNCFYHYLILISISHLKALFNLLLLLLLFIIYIVNLPVVRPRYCRVIYYFDTLTLGRKHQLFWSCHCLIFKEDCFTKVFSLLEYSSRYWTTG